ncbi:subtilisin-like protein [Punctularia strigosozonata HHB-11173 SS5]|uniref:subtilisin-like protein n=1 Tax=Punctularia strigosozonata (strain HHB-11173) TaxID=741275 RepID=UPI00044171B6|nr:subtilisin-like protein [Punctularia strigosozonata HHB-11173 SS5]EIN06455.1 subtilisin-like protein [Punctularia strigosozonata HHB-11173 SS5]
MTLVVFSLLASFAALACANPVARNMVVHEARASAPSGFVAQGPAPADQVLNLRIALKQGDISGLEQRLLEVSSPENADFRQWLSKDDVESFVKPLDETSAAVAQWLSENGVSPKAITPSGDWLQFSVPVSKANEMLEADFSVFTHQATGSQSIRTLAYSIPANLQEHVELIHPTTSFSKKRSGPVISFPNSLPKSQTDAIISDATVPNSCNTSITPACLQALYGIPTTIVTDTDSQIGVTGMDNQFANMADLATFLGTFRPDLPKTTTFALTSVDNGVNTQTLSKAGVEADLDIQYTVGLASGIPTTFITVGEHTQDGDDEGFLDIINALLAEQAPPQVFTTSYGFDTEAELSKSLTVAMCNSYMQLTARGVSILFASGDGGVAATPGEKCSATFLATFPTCPFATLVGATENVNPERGAELSAGGFSNYFAQPSYQSTAVESYLTKLGSEFSGKFNRSGRAYPDVAAQGQRVEIVVSGKTGLVAGTSCSSPIFASVIALLNDELLKAGKPVLGFLNPWAYANPQAFNDITTGNNPGCGTTGFPATAGWDPVTGLGTPNYAAMRTAAGL